MILPVASEVKMKQKLFVLGGNMHQIDDVRRRFGESFDVVLCQSIGEVQRNLEHVSGGAILPLMGANGHDHGVGDVDKLIENIVTSSHHGLEEKPMMPKTLADRVDLLEQKIIESTLTRNRHHRKDTAAELGISRVTLYNKMKKFGMLN
jgi:DNA-binding NtrC family response regulator